MLDIPEYDAWKLEPTPDNMANVVKSLEPTINTEVQRYAGPKPLLRGRAKGLAIKAIRTYDPAHGAQLRSWVVTQLQPLSRYGKQLRPIRASEVAIRQAAEVNRVRSELSDSMGREPSMSELSDQTGLSATRINRIREQVKASITESAFEIDEESATAGLPGTQQSDTLGTAEEMVYDSLTPRDKQIYDWKTGRHGKTMIANQDIAKRLGVTPALISQRSQQMAEQIRDLGQKGSL